jgi:hypothetical protein
MDLDGLARKVEVNRRYLESYLKSKGIEVSLLKIDHYPFYVFVVRQERASEIINHWDSYQAYQDGAGRGLPGYFYVIQPTPELDPHRIKLGFARDVEQRVKDFQTVCPQAQLVDC